MSISLLCTFVQKEELQDTIDKIQSWYNLVYNYMYVLENAEVEHDLFVTYNVETTRGNQTSLDDTILIHRKKETNTLYTINALNMLVKEENNGRLDRTFIIDWSKFKNSIILTNSFQTRRVRTNIFKIIKVFPN